MKRQIKLKIVLMSLTLAMTHTVNAQSLQDLVNTLSNPQMIQLNTKTVENMPTPWGTLKSGQKIVNESWQFTTQKNNQLLSAVFVSDQKNWLLNDLNVISFPGSSQACGKMYKALSDQFQNKLGKPNAQEKGNDEAGTFWQMKNNTEWGIWVSVVMAQHPKTHTDECAVKATLAFGADEYLSEDLGF